jgi:hypothetical protein
VSKDEYFGTDLDKIWRSKSLRVPGYAVYIWNPNRTTLNDVVLGEARSPRYDITHWVVSFTYQESIVFESNEQSVASNVSLQLRYDPDAIPVEITEKTLLDETPIRIYQGDRRVPIDDWVPIFTGILRGNPAAVEDVRQSQKIINLLAVERSENYLNKKVTARSYEKGEDVGKVAVELAIEFMGLDRREVKIGFQDYPVGHPQSQVVDIQIMKGIAQVLFPVSKKPKFDAEGYLVAADTDMDKAPARVHVDKDLIVEVERVQRFNSINNSVRGRGMDANLTAVVERYQRLAHGSITSGFFETGVNDTIWFSEKKGKEEGGRRAKDTQLSKDDIDTIGDFFGENLTWAPNIEPDGFTTFWGKLKFDTTDVVNLRITLIVAYFVLLRATRTSEKSEILNWGTAATVAASNPTGVGLGPELSPHFFFASEAKATQSTNNVFVDTTLFFLLYAMTELGRVSWEISGKPFQNVYQEIVATAQINGILTQKIREVEFRNDWVYDIDNLERIALALLRREIAKGFTFKIIMFDDPLLEVDDVLEIKDRRYYVNEIDKQVNRQSAGDNLMEVIAWRIR